MSEPISDRPCLECGQPATHNHHVVPRVLGGTKTVPLCLACHGLVHGTKLAASNLIRAGLAAKKARVEAGLETWDRGGRPKGTWTKVNPDMRRVIFDEHARRTPVAWIARQVGVSRQTVYAILAQQPS